jgi:hypothetical protein
MYVLYSAADYVVVKGRQVYHGTTADWDKPGALEQQR